MNILKFFLRRKLNHQKLYFKLFKPSPTQYAEYLKFHNVFYSIGEHCSIVFGANITDFSYVRMGDNVRLSICTIFGHDGSVNMLNRAYNKKLDKVGKTDLKDNVFIGHGALIMPNICIGPNAVVGAGSVVTKDVMEGSVVAGNPAKEICKIDDLVNKLEDYTNSIPWSELIKSRVGGYDAEIEPELVKQRIEYFYGSKTDKQ
jgi:acetyltransferase-like isoleucine patch superfamily enzyme